MTDLALQVAKANREGPGTIKQMKSASLSLKETYHRKSKSKERTTLKRKLVLYYYIKAT